MITISKRLLRFVVWIVPFTIYGPEAAIIFKFSLFSKLTYTELSASVGLASFLIFLLISEMKLGFKDF